IPPISTIFPYTTLFRSLSDLKSKFKRKEKLFTELITKDVMKISGDKVVVNFLDEQLTELGVVSEANRKNAYTRWNKEKQHAVARSEEHTSELQSRENLV